MAEKEFLFTQEGFDALKEKLEHLKNVTRKEVSQKIKEARSFGDLSENAEYDEAKNEQAEVEAEILKLEEQMKYARILDDDEINSGVVNPGSRVRILDIEFNEEDEFLIVGSTEADPATNKLSYESPIGAALMHHGVGETVVAETPDGPVSLEILSISR